MNLEAALKEELAGTYDLKSAREKREVEMTITRPISEAMTAKDYPAAVTAIEAATQLRPKLKRGLEYHHLLALYHADLPKGIAVSRDVLKESDQDLGAYQMMLAIFAVETDLSPAAYQFGKTLASEVDQRGITHFLFLAMKADLYFNAGDKLEAVRLSELALAKAEKDPDAKPEMIDRIRKSLAKHKEAL
jgi:tetratricopeptide (TPR) repeat protein